MSGVHFLELSLSQFLIIAFFANLKLCFLSHLWPPEMEVKFQFLFFFFLEKEKRENADSSRKMVGEKKIFCRYALVFLT